MRTRVVATLAVVALIATAVGVAVARRGDSPAGRAIAAPLPKHVPGDFMLSRSGDQDVPEDAFERAVAQANAVNASTKKQAPGVARRSWQLRGPTNIGGRVTDVAIGPKKKDTIYVAAASGGVWRSTDAGDTFEQAWPSKLTQSIGALAITPEGKLYAGTGESNPGGGSMTFGGTGLYTSRNGGKSWNQSGLKESDRISRIMIDPEDSDRIFVAVSGDLFNPTDDRGIYRTTNGGKKWVKVLEGPNETTGGTDLAIDPENTDNVYAVLWDHRREPDLRRYGGEGSGVYRSTDGGDNWTQLGGGLPPSMAETGRMGIGLSPSNPDRLYVVHSETLGFFEGFYASNDDGDSWTKSPPNPLLSNSQSSFGWWFGRVWVTPENANRVFVAGAPLMETTDGRADLALRRPGNARRPARHGVGRQGAEPYLSR